MILSRILLNQHSREVIRDLADCEEMRRTILLAFPRASERPREFEVLFRIEYPRVGMPTLLVQSREHPDWSKLPRFYQWQRAEARMFPTLTRR